MGPRGFVLVVLLASSAGATGIRSQLGKSRGYPLSNSASAPAVIDYFFSLLTSSFPSSDSNFCSTYSGEMTGNYFCFDGDGTGSTGETVSATGTTIGGSSRPLCPGGSDCDLVATTYLVPGTTTLGTAARAAPAGDFSTCVMMQVETEGSFFIGQDDSTSGTQRGWYIAIGATSVTWLISKNSTTSTSGAGTTAADTIVPGAWHLVCMTYDFVSTGTNNVLRGYIDGTQYYSSTTAVGPVQAGISQQILLGRRTNAGNVGGHVRYAFLTDKVLDPATITAMDASLRPKLKSDQGDAIAFASTASLRHMGQAAAEGTLSVIPPNVPRVNARGLYIEGSRTNLVIRSQEFENAAWTAVNMTVNANTANSLGPVGMNTAEEFLDISGDGSGYVQSTGFVPGQTTGTASVYLKELTSDYATEGRGNGVGLEIYDTTAGASRTNCGITVPMPIVAGDTWSRYVCSVSGLTAANTHVLRIYTGIGGYAHPIYVWGAQFEAPLGSFASSYYPTTTASAIRATESATWTSPTSIASAGCISATVTFGTVFGGSLVSNGTEMMMGTNSSTTVRINDGTNTVTATVPDLSGRTVNIRTYWSGTTMGVVADGVSASGTFDGAFSATGTMRIGATTGAAGFAYASIRKLKVGSSATGCQ